MPTYTFRDTTTNIDEDIFMKYSEVESYLENNPSKIKIVTAPSIISGVQSGTNKPDEGFRDILRTIKKNNRRSTINTFD
jgi:ribosome-interacting GTPase 1